MVCSQLHILRRKAIVCAHIHHTDGMTATARAAGLRERKGPGQPPPPRSSPHPSAPIQVSAITRFPSTLSHDSYEVPWGQWQEKPKNPLALLEQWHLEGPATPFTQEAASCSPHPRLAERGVLKGRVLGARASFPIAWLLLLEGKGLLVGTWGRKSQDRVNDTTCHSTWGQLLGKVIIVAGCC